MGEVVRITFPDGREIVMPKDAFRRLLVISRARLLQLKKEEKSSFPEIDNITLNIIEAIQSQYIDLI